MFSLASLGADSNILAILNATTAFNTMVIAYFWLNEDVSLKQIIGLILGFIGIIILVNPQSSSASIIGDWQRNYEFEDMFGDEIITIQLKK